LQNDPKNPKFNFLKNLDDPYRPYYDAQLVEARSAKLVGDEQSEVAVEAALVKEMPKRDSENEFQKLLREEIFGR
jgi:hypothetical protein